MKSLLSDESVQCEACRDIFRAEECVNLDSVGIGGIGNRIPVYDLYILEDKRPERTEVDLLESDVCIQLVIKSFDYGSGNESLNLRQLYDQRHGTQEGYDRNQCNPEYFQSLSYDSQKLVGPTCKINKISDKIRIFAVCNEAYNVLNLYHMADIILGIESSCDDTSAAVIKDGFLLSNVLASQDVHKAYGGVIPELASRAHQLNIVPVVSEAITRAGIKAEDITAIAFTRGPGLLGSLLVGTSFAKGLSLALGKPLVEVNHLQGHILANFIKQHGSENRQPEFPYLCLLVSGGNSQIVRVDSPLEYEILGQTIDDAVGEAFDKCSKMMGLGYPGGPIVDRLAKEGDPLKFKFSKPHIPGFDYSFSGIKTSLLYFVRDQMALDPDFMEKNKADICASFQKALIDILMDKLIKAAKHTGIRQITIGGGVSANSGLRARIQEEGRKRGWTTFLPEFKFTTDNAAMIAIAGWFHYQNGERSSLDVAPVSRLAEF